MYTNKYMTQQGNPIENAVVDRDGDGKITENDKYLYKNAAPDVTMGLSSRLEYKNWDFGSHCVPV